MTTIIPFLQEDAFDPDALRAMSTALEGVSRTLQLDGDQRAREIIAVRIVELARRGERDPERLHDRVLQEAGATTAWANCPNMLLSGLSLEASSLLHTHRERDFDAGHLLWNAGEYLDQVYFPLSGMISVCVPTKNGRDAEVAVIGREGAAGVHNRLGLLPVFTQARVQVTGRFACVSARALAAAARKSEELRWLVAACKDWLLLQAQQMAACNAVHGAHARLCRWLLRATDALGLEAIPATQETIADALGIRRTTGTLIAQTLQIQKAISYRRGKIVIVDRSKLEAAACDCYRVLGKSQWPSELLRSATDATASARLD